MIGVMRSKFGPKVIGGIVAVIAGIFIFSGVFLPGQGSKSPSVAGEVNGEPISYSEYSRSLNQRIEFFKGMMGGKISDEQLAQFKIRETVFQDLAQRKILVQTAKKEGFYPSSEQIRETILKMEAFKKDGRFDKMLYKNVLTQNQYSPTRFEELIAADLMEQNFRSFIGSMVQVSKEEVEQSLADTKNRRKIRYLYVDNETLRKQIDSKDKNAPSLDQVSSDFEAKLIPLVDSGKEAQISKLLNDPKAKMKVSDWLNSQSEFIAGVGSIRSVQSDLYAMKKGDAARSFKLMGGFMIAKVMESESYDSSKVTPKERGEVFSRIKNQKQGELFGSLTQALTKKSKITRNDAVVVGGGGANVPIAFDN